MTFPYIQNPLGSGGYNAQPLPDMTGGIQALQKTEINRRLQEIQQNKEWERQDRLKNEERALKLMMPPAYDGIAGYNAEQFQEKADSYRKFWADKMAATNGNLQMKDWAEVQSKYRELESSVMHGQAKKQAFSEYQRQALTTRNKLETEEEKARFDEQQKVLFDKIFTQKTDWTPYDLMEALQVPERPTRVSVSDFGKEQYGAFTNDGRYDPEATKKNISVRLSRYPDLIKGVNVDYNGIDPSDPRVNDVSSAANAIYQELEPKLKGKPTRGRETPESYKTEAIQTNVVSYETGESGAGARATKTGKPIMVAVTEGGEPTGAEFTVSQYLNGRVEGNMKVVKYIPEKMKYTEASSLQRKDSRIKLGKKFTENGEVMVIASMPTIDEKYKSIPYEDYRDELKTKFPEFEKAHKQWKATKAKSFNPSSWKTPK